MKKNYIARRRGTSVAAAALSFALVAPLAQPVAFAQEDKPAADAAPADPNPAEQPGDQPVEEQDKGEVVEDLFPSRDGQQVIEADAVANGYIKTTIDTTNAESVLTGRALEVTNKGTYAPFQNSQQPVPTGTKVYMQWIDSDGAVSPVYVTETTDGFSTGDDSGGPGFYAFDLREPWFDANGTKHEFRAWGASASQYYRLWIDEYERDGVTYSPFRQAGGLFPGSFWSTGETRQNGAFALLGKNMHYTAFFMAPKHAGLTEAFTRPRDEWKQADVYIDGEDTPTVLESRGGIYDPSVYVGVTDTISGSVWYETGAGDRGNTQTGVHRNVDGADYPAKGYQVVLSQLTQEGYRDYQDAVGKVPEDQRNEKSIEWIKANPDAIDATYYTTVDEFGNYSMQLPKNALTNNVATTDNIWMTVLDEDGNEVVAYSPWLLPQFMNADSTGQMAPRHAASDPTMNAVPRNHRNYSFGILPQYGIDQFDIVNYNVTDMPATKGTDTEPARLEAKGRLTLLPTKLEWRQGNRVLKECPVDNLSNLGDCQTLDFNDEAYGLKDGDIVRAVLVTGEGDGRNEIAADSFAVRKNDPELDANENAPKYEDSVAPQGSEVKVPAPKNEDDKDLPEGSTFGPNKDPNFPVLKDGKPVVDANGDPAGFPGTYQIDPNTGEIMVKPKADAPVGDYEIPVVVHYPDGSAETVYAKVKVVPEYTPNYPGEYQPKDEKKPKGYVTPAGEETTIKVDFDDPATEKKEQAPAKDVAKFSIDDAARKAAEEAGYTVDVDSATGDVKVTPKKPTLDKDGNQVNVPAESLTIPVKVTYTDGALEDIAEAVVYLDTDNDGIPDIDDEDDDNDGIPDTEDKNPNVPDQSKTLEPKYEDASGTPGENVKVEAPTFNDKDGKDAEKPEGTTFAPGETPKYTDKDGNEKPLPEDAVTVDPNTGEITVKVPEDAKPGDKITVPVVVTYPDGSKDPVDVPVTVKQPKDETPAPSIVPGTEVDEVPANGEPKKLDDKVKNPTDGMTGDVLDKDGNPIKDAKVEVDPKTGEIKVTVPEGTEPQDGKVVVKDKDGNKVGEIDIKITEPKKDESPSIVPGTKVDEVPANGEPKPLDDKVKNPTEGMTGDVLDKDGNPIKDAKVEVDPNTGEIKVTVPKGTEPQDGKVVVKDKDGKDVGEIDIKIVDPNSDVAKNVPNYGDRKNVEAGKTEKSDPFEGKTDVPVKEAKGKPSAGSDDWTFKTGETDGVVEATAPDYDKVAEKIKSELPNIDSSWEKFKEIFTPYVRPSVDVDFTYNDGSENSATAGFDLIGQDGKSLLDENGDFDGDGISNKDEIEGGKNPAAADEGDNTDTTAPTVDPVKPGDKKITGKDNRPNSKVTVTFPDGTKEEATTDKDGNWSVDVPAGIELKPGDKITVIDEAGNDTTATVGIDTAKCVATSVGFGLPLIALLPIGLATQLEIPGLSDFAAQANAQIQNANTQIQQQLGIFNPQLATQVDAINAKLGQYGTDLATVAGGLALIAAGILAGTIIYDNCSPNGGGSSVKDLELKGSSGKTYAGSSKEEKPTTTPAKP